MNKLISVIVPLYNEEEVLPESYRRLTSVLSGMEENYELIFVNDGSRDNTLEILRKIAAGAPQGRVLSSANSINFGRLVPQIVYYFSAYADLLNAGAIALGDEVNFVVPTGNFGNILAGYYARSMGLPVKKLICASNRNNVLTDFFLGGVYDTRRQFFKTTSPSMDILISSNLERLLFECADRDGALIARASPTPLVSSGRSGC